MRVITRVDLERALGAWWLLLEHEENAQPGYVEVRLRRPWRWLGQRFHRWVARHVIDVVDRCDLTIGVGFVVVWR